MEEEVFRIGRHHRVQSREQKKILTSPAEYYYPGQNKSLKSERTLKHLLKKLSEAYRRGQTEDRIRADTAIVKRFKKYSDEQEDDCQRRRGNGLIKGEPEDQDKAAQKKQIRRLAAFNFTPDVGRAGRRLQKEYQLLNVLNDLSCTDVFDKSDDFTKRVKKSKRKIKELTKKLKLSFPEEIFQ